MSCCGLIEWLHMNRKFIYEKIISSGCAERISISTVHDGAQLWTRVVVRFNCFVERWSGERLLWEHETHTGEEIPCELLRFSAFLACFLLWNREVLEEKERAISGPKLWNVCGCRSVFTLGFCVYWLFFGGQIGNHKIVGCHEGFFPTPLMSIPTVNLKKHNIHSFLY